jgi:peptide/nickel transport system substrate-binding protein
MKTGSRTAAAWATTGLVVLLAAVGAAGPAQPRRGGTLVIGQNAAPRSLISIIDPGKPGITILNQTEEGLLGYNEKGEIVPVLAEAMPETPDRLTYVFRLRRGVRFHDGDEVTAEHVKYTFERLLDPKYRATFGQVYRDNIERIDVVDRYTVRFTMKQPWPQFVAFAAGNHPKVVNPKVAERPDFGTRVWSGTGPFKIQEWVQGDRVVIVRNDNYWQRGVPYLDRVVYRTIPEDSTRVANLLRGQIHVDQDPSFKDVAQLQRDSRFQVLSAPSNNTLLITFDTCNPPFDRRETRRAVSKALDRAEIARVIFRGLADPAGDLFPPHHWAHDRNIVERYDPEGARALLQQAGYGPQRPLEFTLVLDNIFPFTDAAVLIQAQLARVGIRMEILPMEYTARTAMMRRPKSEWPGRAALSRITPLRSTAFEFSVYQYGAKGALNYSGYNQPGCFQNPQVERLLNLANSYSDFVRRERDIARPIWRGISRQILEDAPQVRIVFWHNVDVLRKEVMGYPLMEGDVNLLMRTWLAR